MDWNEAAAGFAFNVGDTVVHRSWAPGQELLWVVVARSVVQHGTGFYREYACSYAARDGCEMVQFAEHELMQPK